MATAIGSYATTAGVKARLFAAGVTDTADDTLIGTGCDQINQFIETYTRSVLAPITSTTYLYDGDGSGRIYLPFPVDKAPIGGLRAVTVVEIASYTGATLETQMIGDYLLRGKKGSTGPYQWLVLSDKPLGTYHDFRSGMANIRVTGTAGWAAIPDDIIDVALTTVVRWWHARQSGQADTIGSDETGAPLVTRYVAPHHWGTLKAYRAHQPAVIA